MPDPIPRSVKQRQAANLIDQAYALGRRRESDPMPLADLIVKAVALVDGPDDGNGPQSDAAIPASVKRRQVRDLIRHAHAKGLDPDNEHLADLDTLIANADEIMSAPDAPDDLV